MFQRFSNIFKRNFITARRSIIFPCGEEGTITEGKIIIKWIKQGDFVKPGDLLYTMETDKVSVDISTDVPGNVTPILDVGDKVTPDKEICYIDVNLGLYDIIKNDNP